MNAPFPVLFQWAEHWLTAMGRASLYGAVVLVLVWGACACVPRLPSRWRCWLWRMAFLKLLLCLFVAGSLDLAILPSSFGRAEPLPIERGSDANGARRGGALPSDSHAAASQVHTPDFVPGVPAATIAPRPDDASQWAVSAGSILALMLFALWAAVVLGLVGLIAMRIVAARAWRRKCVLIKDPEILTLGEQLARQFGLVQPPLLFEAEFCGSPVVFGALRTAVVLPTSLVHNMCAADLRLVLAHEIAHIRRGDLLSNWFVSLVSGLFFFHPLVWLAFREIRLAQETACDELAVGQSGRSIADYGNLIVDLAARCCRPTSAIVAVGVVESFQNSLRRRLGAMKNFGTESPALVVLSWLLALVALVGLLPWRVVAQSLPSDEPKAAQAPEDPKAAPAKKFAPIRTVSGEYTVIVDGVRPGGGRGLDIRPSGFPMTPQKSSFESFSKQWSSHDTKQGSGGFATASAGGSVGGAAGGMAGGHATHFMRPNLILDLKVEGSKSRKAKSLLCEVNGKVQAEDDRGNKLESPDFPASTRLRLSGVAYPSGDGRTAIHLYQPEASAGAQYLRFVEGELLVVEAKQSRVVFQGKDLTRETTKRDGDVTVRLTKFGKTPEGIDVTLSASPPPLNDARDPMERMQRLMASHGRVNVTLEDTQGRSYSPSQSSGGSSGGSAGGAWSTTMSGGGGQARFEKREQWPTQDLHFEPLPDGAQVKALRCTVTDQLGNPRPVAFHLKDIPLNADNRL